MAFEGNDRGRRGAYVRMVRGEINAAINREFTRGLNGRERQRGLGRRSRAGEEDEQGGGVQSSMRMREGKEVHQSASLWVQNRVRIVFFRGKEGWAGTGPCGLCRLGWSRFYFFSSKMFFLFCSHFLF